MNRNIVLSALTLIAFCVAPQLARADQEIDASSNSHIYRATLPIILGWFDGKPAPYLQLEASDKAVAQAMNVNYAPTLANAANTGAVDDIYAVTNYSQGNVIPSAPIPAGPGNTNTFYSPLWQVSMVTWNAGITPRLLTSETAIKAAAQAGELTIVKTSIIVNCPVMHTPQGGLFPGAKIYPVK